MSGQICKCLAVLSLAGGGGVVGPQEGRGVGYLPVLGTKTIQCVRLDFRDQPFLLNVMFFRSTGGVERINSLLLLDPNGRWMPHTPEPTFVCSWCECASSLLTALNLALSTIHAESLGSFQQTSRCRHVVWWFGGPGAHTILFSSFLLLLAHVFR